MLWDRIVSYPNPKMKTKLKMSIITNNCNAMQGNEYPVLNFKTYPKRAKIPHDGWMVILLDDVLPHPPPPFPPIPKIPLCR